MTDLGASIRMEDRFRFSRDTAAFGEGDPWEWAVPAAFRALADPHGGPLPKRPDKHTDHAQALGYWTALHRLLVYRLGWARPGRGLRAWYDAGQPTDDPTLALVSRVWLADGLLDDYLAWLSGQPLVFLRSTWSAGSPMFEHDPDERLSPAWQRWLDAHQESSVSHISKEGDSLHLSGHPGEEAERDPKATLTITDARDRRAVFVTRSKGAWYFDALKRMQELPDLTPNSWHVDVVTTPVGFMGTYRLSRQTGLIFTGKHSVHTLGN